MFYLRFAHANRVNNGLTVHDSYAKENLALHAELFHRVLFQVPMDNKRILAIHEAGHILLAHLYPRYDWHAFSHLLPGGSVRFNLSRLVHLSSVRTGDSFDICV